MNDGDSQNFNQPLLINGGDSQVYNFHGVQEKSDVYPTVQKTESKVSEISNAETPKTPLESDASSKSNTDVSAQSNGNGKAGDNAGFMHEDYQTQEVVEWKEGDKVQFTEASCWGGWTRGTIVRGVNAARGSRLNVVNRLNGWEIGYLK